MSFILIARAKVDRKLSTVPLVGELVPPSADFQIDRVTVMLTDTALDKGKVETVNQAIGWLNDNRLPLLPGDKTLQRGVTGRVEYTLGGVARDPVQIQLGAVSQQLNAAPTPGDPAGQRVSAQQPPTPTPRPESEEPSKPQTAGPIRLGGVKLGLSNGAVEVTADVTITVSALVLRALGLSIAIKPSEPSAPTVVLSGLGLGLALPAKGITLDGALRHVCTKDPQRYEGEALLITPAVSVTLVGSYSKNKDFSSFFLLGTLQAVGPSVGFGPPPFRVKGLCLGGGYNSRVKPPPIEKLRDFPLVSWAGDDPGGDSGQSAPKDPMAALEALKDTVVPARGENWVAAGLRWTTFEYADFRAVALVEFGTELVISLFALGDFTFPKVRNPGQRPVAQVEIAAELVYSRAQGQLALVARLTSNSYLISEDCKPVGGLAAYVWTAPSAHAGDFVFSLGGYHPGFSKPAWYPAVPRVGIDWPVTDQITVRAQAYGAVTPHAFMLGGALDVRYHNGSLRAWLSAHLDALVDWCKGTYDVSFGISMGVSATIEVWFVSVNVSVEVGVDVRLAGPPLSGTARVHLWFVSFTLHFGAEPPTSQSVSWADFRKQLPPAGAALSVNAVSGRQPTPPGGEADTWYVDTHGFTFTTHSAVPLSALRFGDHPVPDPEQELCIRPMGVRGGTCSHTVRIRKVERPIEHTKWPTPIPVTSAVPVALWDAPGEPGMDGDGLVKDRYTGLRITVPSPQESDSLSVQPGQLDVDALDDGVLCISEGQPVAGRAARAGTDEEEDVRAQIAAQLNQQPGVLARQNVLRQLTELRYRFDVPAVLPEYVRLVRHDLSAQPLVGVEQSGSRPS